MEEKGWQGKGREFGCGAVRGGKECEEDSELVLLYSAVTKRLTSIMTGTMALHSAQWATH